MRPIKFMAWHKAEKEMYPVAGTLKNMVCLESPGNVLTFVDIDEVELLQYTGWTDKNGQDIYENFVVRMFDWDELEQVMWCNNGFYVVPIDSEDVKPQLIPHDYKGRATSLEIVGNIYENPEWDKFS